MQYHVRRKRFGTIHWKRVFQLNYLNGLGKKNANEHQRHCIYNMLSGRGPPLFGRALNLVFGHMGSKIYMSRQKVYLKTKLLTKNKIYYSNKTLSCNQCICFEIIALLDLRR